MSMELTVLEVQRVEPFPLTKRDPKGHINLVIMFIRSGLTMDDKLS